MEVGELVGMSRERVREIVGSPLFQQELTRKREEGGTIRALSILEEAAPEAAIGLTELLRSEDEDMRLRAQKELFAQVFRGRDTPQVVNNVSIQADQINVLKEALKEIRSL